MIIRPKKWGTFQHYKDRNPPWIKLHKELLDNYEYQSLPVASKALAPMLWLIASERDEGVIDAENKKLCFRLRMNPAELEDALRPLIAAEFFEVVRPAIGPLADRKRDAMPETEVETQVQTETQGRQIARSADADEPALALQAYNTVAQELGWSEAIEINPTRLSKLRKRLSECRGIEGWRAAMIRARASPFLRGETGRDKAHETWAPDLDFFLKQTAFTKLREGKYDARTNNQGPSGFSAVLAGARVVASQ